MSSSSVVFGDWSRFAIRLAGPMRLEQSSDYKFGTDQVSFRAIQRFDCATLDTTGGALKHFIGGAS